MMFLPSFFILSTRAAVGTALLFAPGPQEKPQLDEVAEQALKTWEALEWRPVEDGLIGGSCTVKAHLTVQGETRGSASYRWEGEGEAGKSSLDWDPPSLGARLAQEGWAKDRFDADFLHLDGRSRFRGCTLIGHSGDDGTAWIEVRGESPTKVKELHFDSAGRLVKELYEVKAGPGNSMNFTLAPRYRELEGGLVVKVGQRFEMDAGFGKIESNSEIEHAWVEGVLVPKLVIERSTWNGQPSGENRFEFSNWKLRKKSKDAQSGS